MKDFLLKLWILFAVICDGIEGAFQYWKKEMWPNGLDEYECCDGGTGSRDSCGCGGSTIRKTWFKK